MEHKRSVRVHEPNPEDVNHLRWAVGNKAALCGYAGGRYVVIGSPEAASRPVTCIHCTAALLSDKVRAQAPSDALLSAADPVAREALASVIDILEEVVVAMSRGDRPDEEWTGLTMRILDGHRTKLGYRRKT